ncbi:hypothetical protein PBY51_013272 [Eleginops maclovinus]|uniref:TNFR-Cys domain-containing protein n=1 Tax=Eleginops maclovinus TaxID=56733 RepID=A0AAN8AXR3_ELEMC|nr:hypothetical protein PBY51_013272 [Eleginops maclovinus]
MILLKLLIFTLTFYELIYDLDAQKCPSGQRINVRVRSRESFCEPCPDGYFQPVENHSQYCKACTHCDHMKGSVLKVKCTKETDTECQCRGGFVRHDSSTCRCKMGFELKHGECSECEDGFFSSHIGSQCQKWKECKSGVKLPGNKTSDVLCNMDSYITAATTSNTVSVLTRITSHHSHEADKAKKSHPATNTNITTATSIITTSTKAVDGPPRIIHPSDSISYFGAGMVLLIFGIVGLLVLTAATCKLHVNLQPAVPKNESLCRSPVEESGDDSLSSLKPNQEHLS